MSVKRKRVGHDKRAVLEQEEIKKLQRTIDEQAPDSGTNPLSLYKDAAAAVNNEDGGQSRSYASARRFDELPISRYTREALKAAHYTELTAIQRAALPHALAGRDVLGAAKTGSGKTLAFLIPLLEKLYRERWNKFDGLGGLIITPTRELALQIFQQLRRVGARHDFSAGLLVGGNNVKEEQTRVNVLNILVCTPGRLLQHMDETPGFETNNLQVLVLDEADRILDMGFAATMDAIIANLPQARQTLLFSATQTKSVKDLARLSLHNPEYLSVHDTAASPTPVKLQQAYMMVGVEDKLNLLWSFIKAHIKAKMIVFLSTCKQVRVIHEAFRRLRPGVPLRCLHGHMAQGKRMTVYQEFCDAKSMVLFATDIAARGLDFPTVDWVIQVDCPEDTATYIHRVGRTARYINSGKALLFLLPSERAMVQKLAAAQVPLKMLKSNPDKLQSITTAIQALMAKNEQLKEWAQRALVAYLRSVFLQPDKSVFDVLAVSAEGLATSLGLPSVPKLRFLKREAYKKGVPVQEAAPAGNGTSVKRPESAAVGSKRKGNALEASDDEEVAHRAHPVVASDSGKGGHATQQHAARRQAAATASPADSDAHAERNTLTLDQVPDGDEDGDELLVVKRFDVHGVLRADQAGEDALEPGTKKPKKLKIKASTASIGKKVVFDDEGAPQDPLSLVAATIQGDDDVDGAVVGGLDVGEHEDAQRRFEAAGQLLRQRDLEDKQRQKDKRRQARLDRKAKRKAALLGETGAPAVLATPDGRTDSEDSDHRSASEGDSSDEEPVTKGSALHAPRPRAMQLAACATSQSASEGSFNSADFDDDAGGPRWNGAGSSGAMEVVEVDLLDSDGDDDGQPNQPSGHGREGPVGAAGAADADGALPTVRPAGRAPRQRLALGGPPSGQVTRTGLQGDRSAMQQHSGAQLQGSADRGVAGKRQRKSKVAALDLPQQEELVKQLLAKQLGGR